MRIDDQGGRARQLVAVPKDYHGWAQTGDGGKDHVVSGRGHVYPYSLDSGGGYIDVSWRNPLPTNTPVYVWPRQGQDGHKVWAWTKETDWSLIKRSDVRVGVDQLAPRSH